MVKNNEYWAKRTHAAYDQAWLDVKVRQLYADAWKDVEDELTKAYKNLQRRELTRSEIYTVTRYLNMRKRIKDILGEQATALNANLEKALLDVYKRGAEIAGGRVGNVFAETIINPKFAEACVKTKWSGELYSSKIWNKRDKLAREIEKNVRDCVINGDSYTKFMRNINEVWGGRRKEVYRLVRTELAHTLNTAQIDTYKSEGVNYLELDAEADACPICLEVENRGHIPINKIPWTIAHPNCRCVWLPVEDDEYRRI